MAAIGIGTDQQTEKQVALERAFSEFLEQDHGLSQYSDALKEVFNSGKLRLDVPIHELREFRADLHKVGRVVLLRTLILDLITCFA